MNRHNAVMRERKIPGPRGLVGAYQLSGGCLLKLHLQGSIPAALQVQFDIGS